METRNPPYSNNEDRISKLPETLIHHILSFLDMRYVIQTSVLSTKWRYLWTSLTSLTFDANLFYDPKMRIFLGFTEFVDKVLILRKNCDIERFSIVWHETEYDILTSRLSTWIISVLRRHVQELSINIIIDQMFPFPECLFNSNSLVKLELSSFSKFESEVFLPDTMGLPNLKYLKLSSLRIEDRKLTRKLFRNCPELETLIIINCNVKDTKRILNISSSKLDYFELDNLGYIPDDGSRFKTVKICAQNLKSFVCKDYMSQEYSLENLSSLVVADIKMVVEQCEEDEMPETYLKLDANVRETYTQCMMRFLEVFHDVKDLTLSPGFLQVISGSLDLSNGNHTRYCNLRYMKLQTWVSRHCLHSISYLLRISPNLRSLILRIPQVKSNSSNRCDDWEAGSSFSFVLPHLKFVKIRGVTGCNNELKFLEILLKNSSILEKMVIHSSRADSLDKERQLIRFSEKIMSFSKASPNSYIFFFQS